jgi:hypothetical protein
MLVFMDFSDKEFMLKETNTKKMNLFLPANIQDFITHNLVRLRLKHMLLYPMIRSLIIKNLMT